MLETQMIILANTEEEFNERKKTADKYSIPTFPESARESMIWKGALMVSLNKELPLETRENAQRVLQREFDSFKKVGVQMIHFINNEMTHEDLRLFIGAEYHKIFIGRGVVEPYFAIFISNLLKEVGYPRERERLLRLCEKHHTNATIEWSNVYSKNLLRRKIKNIYELGHF